MIKSITKIAVVEDREDMLQFLLEIFEEAGDFECLQHYRNAEEAITFLPRSEADIVIVDIGLPGKSGIECVKQVKELRPDIEFLMYTVFDQNDKIFESLKVGASGYLMKTSEKKVMLNAVRELAEGGAPMSPAIARKVRNHFYEGNNTLKKLKLLSPKENQVLKLLSQGLLYKEIAAEMNIVIGTVKQHIHSIYKKLHVQNRTEAINKYYEHLGRKF